MITLDVSDECVPELSRWPAERYGTVCRAFADRFPDIEGAIGVSFVDDEEIRRLNRVYREKDAVTDVLSFASAFGEQTGLLGDVIISFPQAERQAEAGDIDLELTDLLVHGILHVLGYDHEAADDAAVMFPIQDALVATIL